MKVEKFNEFKKEEETSNYMFFSNLESIKTKIDELLSMDKNTIDEMLKEHDWASDHMSVANENVEHVYEFFKNITK